MLPHLPPQSLIEEKKTTVASTWHGEPGCDPTGGVAWPSWRTTTLWGTTPADVVATARRSRAREVTWYYNAHGRLA